MWAIDAARTAPMQLEGETHTIGYVERIRLLAFTTIRETARKNLRLPLFDDKPHERFNTPRKTAHDQTPQSVDSKTLRLQRLRTRFERLQAESVKLPNLDPSIASRPVQLQSDETFVI